MHLGWHLTPLTPQRHPALVSPLPSGPQRIPRVTQQISVLHIEHFSQSQPHFFINITCGVQKKTRKSYMNSILFLYKKTVIIPDILDISSPRPSRSWRSTCHWFAETLHCSHCHCSCDPGIACSSDHSEPPSENMYLMQNVRNKIYAIYFVICLLNMFFFNLYVL